MKNQMIELSKNSQMNREYLIKNYVPIDDIKSRIDFRRDQFRALSEDKDPIIEAFLNNYKHIKHGK